MRKSGRYALEYRPLESSCRRIADPRKRSWSIRGMGWNRPTNRPYRKWQDDTAITQSIKTLQNDNKSLY